MNRLLVLIGALAIASVPSIAQADVADDPCSDLEEGDECTTFGGKDGTCVDDGGILDCVEDEGDGDGSGSSDGCSAASPGSGAAPFLAFAVFVGGGLAALRVGRRKRA